MIVAIFAPRNVTDSLYTINQRQAKTNTTIGILRYRLNYVSFGNFLCQREENDLKYLESKSIEEKIDAVGELK